MKPYETKQMSPRLWTKNKRGLDNTLAKPAFVALFWTLPSFKVVTLGVAPTEDSTPKNVIILGVTPKIYYLVI